MSFRVQDLMINVVPPILALPCLPDTTPPEVPKPCPAPSCQKQSAKAAEDEDALTALPALAVLREQLREALGA